MERSGNSNGLIIMLIAILLMASSGLLFTGNARADPPQSGSWYIFGTEAYSDRILFVNGSLYITEGSRLNLDNVTLLINSTFDGQFWLRVNSTGELYANNTVITSYNPAFKFRFEVYGNLTMNYSEASEMWGAPGEPFPGGIQVTDGNLSMYRTTVKNSAANGIHIVNSRANIKKSDIINNWRYELYAINSSYMNISSSNFTDSTDVQLAGGIEIKNCTYFNISHSTVSGHRSTGITIDDSPYSTIYNNTIGPNDLPTAIIALNNSDPFFNITYNDLNGGVGIGYTSPFIAYNVAGSLGFDNSNPIILNNSIGNMLISNFSNATIINNTVTGGGIALYDYSYAWIENTVINGGDVIHAYSSNAFMVNSTLTGSIFLSSDSHVTALNVTGSVFVGNYLAVEDTSNITIKNYLHVRTLNEILMPIQDADIKVAEEGNIIYASPGYAGIDPQTDSDGIIGWIIAVDRVYNNDFYVPGHPFTNISYFKTMVEVSKDSYVFAYNPREAEMYSSHTEVFAVDMFPPQISDVIASPDPQEVFEYVNISANITDEGNLYGAWLNVTRPDASWTNATMDNVSAIEFYHNDTYNVLGQYQFTIWANDTNSNWNYSTGTFSIKDSSGPAISNLNISPQVQDVYSSVNVTADITDNYDVFPTGSINITSPTGTFLNATMQRIGNNFYFNHYCDIIGVYSLTIWANDSSDNWAFDTGSFTVKDSEKPLLTNIFITPSVQEVHGNVNVSVNILDNYELYPLVRINIIRPDGSGKNYSTVAVGNNYYLNQSYNFLGVYSLTIWTKDTSNNWNFSVGAFEIVDNTIPEIEAITVVPSQPAQNDYATISASVKDNYLLSEVRVVIIRPNSMVSNFSMDYDYTYKTYYFFNTYWTAGDYEFRILAVDSSNNWNSSSGQFRVRDSTPPEIYVISSVSSESTGKDIIVSAYITDNEDINTVRIYYTDVDGVARTEFMSIVGGVYKYTIPGQTSEGALTYYVWVNDSAGNRIASNTYEIEILQEDGGNDNPPPANTVFVAALVFLTPIIIFIVIILLLERSRKR